MKRLIRFTCIIMAMVLLLAVPVYAEEASTRSSSFIASYDSYLWKISDNQFQIWFDIDGMGTMDEIGVSLIKVQRRVSPDDEWITVRTYRSSERPEMIRENASGYYHYVTFGGASGYYYRAIVTFYAKNSNGIGKTIDYAETIYM